MASRETAIKEIAAFVEECRSKGLLFKKVYLFGSAAKNQCDEWSDIDLLLVSDQFNDNIFENIDLYSDINIKYPAIETHPYPTEIFNKGSDFIDEILKSAIEIQ